MAGFYIKKVIAKSAAKGDASVSFGRGLTIIQGRSDSGKTCVANCIDFIFGGSVDKPFKESAKYDGVTMIVASNDKDGEITLHRDVGKNQVDVTSGIEGISSGTYDVNYRKGAKNPPLNEVWLAQMEAKKQEQAQAEAAFQQTFAPQQTQPSGGFCVNCGTRLDPGAKFCPGCGTAVGSAASPSVPPVPQQSNPGTRQQEFAGTVLKCPNCGAVISQTTAVCPECGHHITGQAAVSSVQAFSDKLMLLESRRKGAGLGQIFGVSVDPVDNQKLSLIRSFPIPNTIDDIQEFMLLAIANIDVGLSKNTLNNRYQSKMKSGESSLTMPRTISDAWVSKMKQAYQKAAAAFPNEPAFAYVRQLYMDKMAELKMKLDE